jgi:hypothetical protein
MFCFLEATYCVTKLVTRLGRKMRNLKIYLQNLSGLKEEEVAGVAQVFTF